MQLRDDVLTELKKNFLSEFQKSVTQLTQQLKQNQLAHSTPTVSITKTKNGVDDIQITISGQELFYSKLKQSFESMVRKSQRDQLAAIHHMLVNTDMVLRPELHQ